MFPLCYTCAETKQQSTCTHADNKRAFVGTWVSDELKKAVDLGYEVQTIYEVWNFNEVNQYDPQTKTGGLFTSYIDTFAKLKQQASGWPSDCDTESKKAQYINNYKDKEGIIIVIKCGCLNPEIVCFTKMQIINYYTILL